MRLCQQRAINQHCRTELLPLLAICLSMPSSEVLATCGYLTENIITTPKTLFSASFLQLLPLPTLHLTTSNLHWPNNVIFLQKLIESLQNQPSSICQFSHINANRQLSIILLNKHGHYVRMYHAQHKASFLLQYSTFEVLKSANQVGACSDSS